MISFVLGLFVSLSILILRWPYLGIVFTAASLPVIDLAPPIPGFTSIVSAFGAVTLFGYLLQRLPKSQKPLIRLDSLHVLGLCFIAWIYLSNPTAAWSGSTRNWVFTFFQLWVLMWLAGELLDTLEKHHVFMWVFAIVTLLSALVAVQQGGIGADIYTSRRVGGLAEGSNAAARYFVVGMVFLVYLREDATKPMIRHLATGGIILTIFGLFFTSSRTGILLLFSAFGLLFLLQTRRKKKAQLVLVFVVGLIAVWFVADSVINIAKSMLPSISQGNDTVGLRYKLWQAGLLMWWDHILDGVGIGMFPVLLWNYGQYLFIPVIYMIRGLVAHNTYVQMLAETGLIGFFIFAPMHAISLLYIWNAKSNDITFMSLRNTWLVVFLIMLLGGITRSEHFDKLIWISMGISMYFRKQNQAIKQKPIVLKPEKQIVAYLNILFYQ